jgi:hypothetical protein
VTSDARLRACLLRRNRPHLPGLVVLSRQGETRGSPNHTASPRPTSACLTIWASVRTVESRLNSFFNLESTFHFLMNPREFGSNHFQAKLRGKWAQHPDVRLRKDRDPRTAVAQRCAGAWKFPASCLEVWSGQDTIGHDLDGGLQTTTVLSCLDCAPGVVVVQDMDVRSAARCCPELYPSREISP